MSICRDSVFSSDSKNDLSPGEKQLEEFVKQMLAGRLFIGTFQEKRYVDLVKSYRDVIVILEEESDLIRDLEVVKQRIQNYYKEDHWVGITTPDIIGAPAGYCLWVKLSEEVFGSYWYKISKVKFSARETLLRLKIIRPCNTIGSNTISFKKLVKCVKQSNASTNDESCSSVIQTVGKEWFVINWQQFQSVLTVQNTAEVIKFLFLLLVALCSGLLKLVEFMGNFTIKLMHEISFFVNSMTPIIIACINLVAKIIGGFYLLILSMWRDRNGPPRPYNSPYVNRVPIAGNRYDQYNTVYYRRALPPPRKSGVVITPLQ